MTPDAWDECGACGHDRDDHTSDGCRVGTFHLLSDNGPSRWQPCPCGSFTEEEDG